ncbi:MAG: WD40 repeat domain-containing protein, partial [Caldilineaceae bacterium]|nr:WD40 repeat domain-containing protein [Caldilineaceae bacterium]
WSAALGSNGKTLAICGGDSSIRIYEVKPNRRVEMIKILQGHRPVLPAAAFSPSGHLLALGDSLGSIRLWDLAQREPQCDCTLQSQDWIEALAFSPDGQYLASTGATNDHAIYLWDVAAKECIAVLAGHTQRVRALAFAPDGAVLASAGRDFAIRPWDVKHPGVGRTLHVLHGHENMIYSLDFNHDGAQLVSCSQDQTVRLWDIATGQQIHVLPGLGENRCVQFSPYANILACSAARHAAIRLLDTTILQEVQQLSSLSRNADGSISFAFGPDGQQLVSGNADHTVTLWDIKKATAIYTLEAHTAYIKSVIFSPDGRHFFSNSLDGTARLWDVETGKCVHIFHAALPYQGMNITGVTGISAAQRAALKALGAVEQ